MALSLMVLVSYLPAMFAVDFIWDDFVIGTDTIRSLDGLRQIWLSPGDIPAEGHYWPLTYTTFWLEHKLWRLAPRGYHVTNVVLHMANTLLLWRLLRGQEIPGAWVAAAVFAVHPVHVESVAWIIERKDVLSGLFYLLAATAWVRFVEEPRRGRYVWALAAYVAGMLSKSVVVTLPVALLIWHWWKRGRVTWNDLLRLAPFFVVGLVISVADLLFNRSRGVGGFGYSFLERILISARAFWFYIGKLFWPADLAVIYPHWDVRFADALGWVGAGAAIGLVVVLWLLRRRVGRGPLAGVLFFTVMLSPVLGFVDYNFMLFSFVADRYQYLASIGLTTVAVGVATRGLATVQRRAKLRSAAPSAVLIVLLVAVLGTLAWRQANLYRDAVTFFSHVVSHNPTAREAHLNLGSALLRWNRLDEALVAYRVAEQQRPDDCKPAYGIGLAFHHLGHIEEAEAAYHRALELCPRYREALVDFAALRLDQQRYAHALRLSNAAIELYSRDASAWINTSRALYGLGRVDEALTSIERALIIEPRNQDAQEIRAQIVRNALLDS